DPLPAEQATKLFASLRRRHCTCPERPYLAAAVDAIEFGAGHGLRESLEREADLFVPLMFHPNSRNKIDLFFTTTAAGPRLVPTNPKNVRPVPRIAVLGAGLMGQGIAQITADAGTPVLLVDIERRFVDGAMDSITRSLDGLVAKGRWEEKRRAAVIAAIEGTTDYSRLAEVPLVIEAVPEDVEVKRRVLSQVQAVNPGIIFASNTSAIPMEDIAEGSVRPEMVVGMHYFSPVPLMALLEVVRGPGSSAEAVDTAVALGRRQKKTCVLVRSSPGFYTSRLFGQFVCMGFRLAELGADPFVVDSLAVEAGFPRGPLHMFGSVGGMVVYHAGRFMQERFPGRHPLPASLEKVALAGYTGAGRRSFYLDERGLEPDRSVLDHLVRTPGLPVPDAREIKDMLLLGMVSEAFACLSEGVIDDFVTMDLAAVLGVGFPDCWHGPARFVSSAGVSRVVARLEALGQKFGIPALVPSRDLRTLVARGIEHGLA
ncbi:MAG: hypothetical protein FJ098_08765, partial [Deltaproteobacteria bacterium]|nr:hypothetical protein [Deltaproteobacteria bacterium]